MCLDMSNQTTTRTPPTAPTTVADLTHFTGLCMSVRIRYVDLDQKLILLCQKKGEDEERFKEDWELDGCF